LNSSSGSKLILKHPVSLQHIIIKDRDQGVGNKAAYFIVDMDILGQDMRPEYFQPYTAHHNENKPPQLLREGELVSAGFRMESPYLVYGKVHDCSQSAGDSDGDRIMYSEKFR
jgi:hypothetical protein